jgi:hypothetical protein
LATQNRPTRAKLAEHVRNVWQFKDEFAVDTTIDCLLDPETWAHCAAHFSQGDEIIVVPQGMPYRAHLIVVDAGKVHAKVRLIGVALLNAPAEEAPAEDGPMYVKWNLGVRKYSIYRRSDNEKVHDGFAIKAEAEEWAVKHALALAA